MFKGGYEVKGDFVSAEAGYDNFRFPDFRAAVVWVPTRLDVTSATAKFYGGTVDFTYDPVARTAAHRSPWRWRCRSWLVRLAETAK